MFSPFFFYLIKFVVCFYHQICEQSCGCEKKKCILWCLSYCRNCFPRKISLKLCNRLLSYGQKNDIQHATSNILNFNFFYIYSRDCQPVPHLLLCTKFYRNRAIFRWDMAISRILRCRPSAILNFMDLRMGSLKSPCTTLVVNRDHSSKLLSFWKKSRFCVLVSGDRQTDKHIDIS